MIPVIVRKDDFPDIGQIDLQVACVLQHRVRVGSGIQQNAMTICLDQRRKSPLAQPRCAATSMVDSRVTLSA